MRFMDLKCVAAGLLAAVSMAVFAGPLSVGFDDIDASGGDTPISNPYFGLTWTNFTAYTVTPGFPGFNNGIVSGPNAAYGGGETTTAGGIAPLPSSVSAGAAFDFVSGFFGAGYYDGLSLTAQGMRGGSVLYSRTVLLGTGGAQAFSFNFTGIDKLTFMAVATAQSTDPFACGGFNCTQFTLDNVVLSAVPEPTSAALLLAGLLVIASAIAWPCKGIATKAAWA